MALYDYRCASGHVREVRHGMNEAPRVFCDHDWSPEFGCGLPMEKAVGAVDFIPCPGMASFDKRLPPIRVNGHVHRP